MSKFSAGGGDSPHPPSRIHIPAINQLTSLFTILMELDSGEHKQICNSVQ